MNHNFALLSSWSTHSYVPYYYRWSVSHLMYATAISLSLWTEVTCPDDRVNPINGAIQIMTGLNFGSLVTYLCDPTYALIGTSTQTCEANGLWTDEPPTCQSKCAGYTYSCFYVISDITQDYNTYCEICIHMVCLVSQNLLSTCIHSSKLYKVAQGNDRVGTISLQFIPLYSDRLPRQS